MKIAALLFALLACATPAFAQTAAHSSPEDRQRFVAIVHNLERDPLSKSLQHDRQWAMQWLIDAPDVTVSVCLDPLGHISGKDYAHSDVIVVQYSFAMAAFIIENPGKESDVDAQQLAGVEGALNAYRAMHAAKPDEKSPTLDKMLETQSRGELPAYVREAYSHCTKS